MDRYDQRPPSVNPPSSPSTYNDDQRAAALEAHTLANVLCDQLTALPAGAIAEQIQVLAVLAEEAARRSFELADGQYAGHTGATR